MEDKKVGSKWMERKWLISLTAFVMLIVGSIVEANSQFVFPMEIKGILGGIVATWLVTEGFLDNQRIKQGSVENKNTQ